MRNHISNAEILAANEREERNGRGTSKREAKTMPVEYDLSFADAIHPESA